MFLSTLDLTTQFCSILKFSIEIPLTTIEVNCKTAPFKEAYYNFTLCTVTVVILGTVF